MEGVGWGKGEEGLEKRREGREEGELVRNQVTLPADLVLDDSPHVDSRSLVHKVFLLTNVRTNEKRKAVS